MLLLVTDTSGKQGRVALARAADGGDIQVLDTAPLAGGTFSAQLVPQIAALLSKRGFTKNDISGFVVVSGPGSFTGLRVGLAAVKALAEILQKPIAAVSLLEVVAVAADIPGRVLAALDAGRGGVFTAEYEIVDSNARLLREQLMTREELRIAARASAVVTPDAAVAVIVRDFGGSAFELESVDAEMIAHLGLKKLRAGETVGPEQLEANYLRPSDAELFTKPASGS
jgi:tRNA threonylcarbamoyladenosine biosynthesis protein TsaB